MANALKEAPVEKSKEELVMSMKFDAGKKYMFELAQENLERELPVVNMTTKRAEPHKKFKPFQNIVFTSQIIWDGQRRMLRYYDGCNTLFTDEQPKDKDIVDQLVKQSRPRSFEDGKFGCFGDERMLLLYLTICSWNTDSEFRTRTANGIFKPVNADKAATAASKRLDATEQALNLAKEATVSKMRMHSNYLGIPLVDNESGNDLTDKEIRIRYREEALRNSETFIDSFGNKSIETKYYINKAWNSGLINNKQNINRAAWANSNAVICDISGLRSGEAIEQRLFEFSQTEEGQEFAIQVKAVAEAD